MSITYYNIYIMLGGRLSYLTREGKRNGATVGNCKETT